MLVRRDALTLKERHGLLKLVDRATPEPALKGAWTNRGARLFVGVPLFAIGTGVAAAAIGAGDFGVGKAVIAAVVATGATACVQPRLARRQFHRRVIVDRLWTWEKPNPATHVQILLRDDDRVDAIRVLRRAGFNPSAYAAHLGAAVPPDLEIRMGVDEPHAHPQSSSDEDRLQRIAYMLDAGGIPARVGGVDVPRASAA